MLTVEMHDGRLWLVRLHAHGESQLLAEFSGMHEVEVFKAEIAQSMAFSREVGRSGLG